MADDRARRGDVTRAQLVAVATRLFAERGYDGTAIEAVIARSGVSRGGLYHHFAGKDALFEAVFAAVEADIGRQVFAAAGGWNDPVEALRAGSRAWIRLAGDPVVRRIVLVDAPAVLGWSRWRTIGESSALGMLRAALQDIAERGRLEADLVDVLAHVLLAAVNEIALFIAGADDRAGAVRTGERAVDELLDRLAS